MAYNFVYMPTFRARQQEIVVLNSFDFGERIFPMIEIIKSKDRTNNQRSSQDIWNEIIARTSSLKVLVDLPVYLRETSSMQTEVLTFNRTVLTNLQGRIDFFRGFAVDKTIPVISSLTIKTGETDTIKQQIAELRPQFPVLAVRTFINSLEIDSAEIRDSLNEDDIIIYDMDTVQPLSPLVRRQLQTLRSLPGYKIALRSAINTEIQNTKLDHEEVVAEADNSLTEVFRNTLQMNGFGDFVGIKKDEMSAGGTISPGFILYDPVENIYYGYKGEVKNLAEFENTIVPAVLSSGVVTRMREDMRQYLDDGNHGFEILNGIASGIEAGKSQAKFKRIAMEHYLYVIKKKIQNGDLD